MRDGEIVVIAAGLAWQGGAGTWQGHSGNARALGTEYQRAASQPLTAEQLRVGRIWTRCRNAAFSIARVNVCEHSEYATPVGRKVDRSQRPGVRISGADWRAQLAQPSPPPTGPEGFIVRQEDEAKIEQIVDKVIRAREQSIARWSTLDLLNWGLGDPQQDRERSVATMIRHTYGDSRKTWQQLNGEGGCLSRIAATGAVAAMRVEAGLDPDPESDAIQVDRLAAGSHNGRPYGVSDVADVLTAAAERAQDG